MTRSRSPFDFKSAAHLLFIERERASHLAELLDALRSCPDGSIFQHILHAGRTSLHQKVSRTISRTGAYSELGMVGLGSAWRAWTFASLPPVGTSITAHSDGGGLHRTKSNAREHTAESPFYFCSSSIVILPVELR
jgi:hypothetical protein